MKTKLSLMFVFLIVLAACAPQLGLVEPIKTGVLPPIETREPTHTVALPPTATIELTDLPPEPISTALVPVEQYRVGNFSDEYYGIVQVEKSDEINQGWISIFDKETDRALIKVRSGFIYLDFHEGELKANILELPYGEQSLIIHDDFNFDGIKDFAIQVGPFSCYGMPAYDVYLAQNGMLVFNEAFTRLAHEYCGMFSVSEEDQAIYTMTKSGCCWHQYSKFVVEDNAPAVEVVIEEEWYPPYFYVIFKEWADGELKITEEKYIDWEEIQDGIVLSFDLLGDDRTVVLFSLTGQSLNYTLLVEGDKIEFDFPLRNVDNDAEFLYIEDGSEVTLRFAREDTVYELYQASSDDGVERVGVRVIEGGIVLDLKGDIATIEGDLREIENVVMGNLVFE